MLPLVGVGLLFAWLPSRWEKLVAKEGRRKVCVAPLVRVRDLHTQQSALWDPRIIHRADCALPLPGCVTYQSPLPVFRPLLTPSLLVSPAAADAKLDVNGEGMILCCQVLECDVRGAFRTGDWLRGLVTKLSHEVAARLDAGGLVA